jgi:hypothetical protein
VIHSYNSPPPLRPVLVEGGKTACIKIKWIDH